MTSLGIVSVRTMTSLGIVSVGIHITIIAQVW
jgi:hypothetical protein